MRRFVAVVGLALVLLPLALPPRVISAPDGNGADDSPYMDADRNRIFDTLDDELADKNDTWSQLVVVTLEVPPTDAQSLRSSTLRWANSR